MKRKQPSEIQETYSLGEVKAAVIAKGLTNFLAEPCIHGCGDLIGFEFEQGKVYFEHGCSCQGGSNRRETDWEEIQDCVNTRKQYSPDFETIRVQIDLPDR